MNKFIVILFRWVYVFIFEHNNLSSFIPRFGVHDAMSFSTEDFGFVVVNFNV